MDLLNKSLLFFFAITSVIALCGALYKAFKGEPGSSAALTVIFVVTILIFNLPHLEKFKVFGVEASLREEVVEAKQLLERVRSISVGTAKALYLEAAWSGCIGGMPASEKQRALDAVSEQL